MITTISEVSIKSMTNKNHSLPRCIWTAGQFADWVESVRFLEDSYRVEVSMGTLRTLITEIKLQNKKYLSEIGRKGGSAKSKRKTEAARRNAKRPRPKKASAPPEK
jgi:hypothetical protein